MRNGSVGLAETPTDGHAPTRPQNCGATAAPIIVPLAWFKSSGGVPPRDSRMGWYNVPYTNLVLPNWRSFCIDGACKVGTFTQKYPGRYSMREQGCVRNWPGGGGSGTLVGLPKAIWRRADAQNDEFGDLNAAAHGGFQRPSSREKCQNHQNFQKWRIGPAPASPTIFPTPNPSIPLWERGALTIPTLSALEWNGQFFCRGGYGCLNG